MNLRLRVQLEAGRHGTANADSIVDVGAMTTFDRDMLRDALRVVRRFRELIRMRYNLGSF